VLLSRIALTDFRSYSELELELESGISTFLGRNGQGKTNLVEAIGYLARFDSHRVASDAPLVRAGAERAVVRAAVEASGRRNTIEVEINPGRVNRVRLNGAPTRPREAVGLVRTVVFAPEDLSLAKGDPSERRRFLDDLLVLRTPRLSGVRSDYERVVKQRNSLLKSMATMRSSAAGDPNAQHTLEVWDEQLASVGAQLMRARLDLLRDLRPYVQQWYSTLAPAELRDVGLEYRSSAAADSGSGVSAWTEQHEIEKALSIEILARRADEVRRGVSLVGPHRDDVTVSIGDLPAKGYASHGESWSLALALRLASYSLLDAGGDQAILVLDDVFAELDAQRRGSLASAVLGADQIVITAAADEDVPRELTGSRYDVAVGSVHRRP
jgi:DNA replication and repair protein RecF